MMLRATKVASRTMSHQVNVCDRILNSGAPPIIKVVFITRIPIRTSVGPNPMTAKWNSRRTTLRHEHIDRHHKIAGQRQEGGIEPGVGREANPASDEEIADNVDVLVEKIAVAWASYVAHARQCAVQ